MGIDERITEIQSLFNKLGKEKPDLTNDFMKLVNSSLENGELSQKYKEIIMVSLSLATGCEWCIPYHVSLAIKAGATRGELLESAFLALLMTGTPALMKVIDLLKYLDEKKQ
ncbi:MAG: carboxymuconolactone decarboxylase family protein [Candidatus Thermoplasmatota archaeon]|jgi:AhpD family alkylhydroperoxidase|nr:carboxymuconolactone decarboxylase family protein [Candidatus Thermoplasmatota archaeon]MCL5681137.1 carboxymuconolactone decarboxylase family protein [Candidatus Thermoplasmatota archaeon]